MKNLFYHISFSKWKHFKVLAPKQVEKFDEVNKKVGNQD